MQNRIGLVTILIGLFAVSLAFAGGAPAAKGGRIARASAKASEDGTVSAKASTDGGTVEIKTTAPAVTADPAPAAPTASTDGSINFGEHGWGCQNGLIVVNKATLAKAFGHGIANGSTCLVYNNQTGFPNSGKHAPTAQCDECRAHGSRFGEGGGFCRYTMDDNGNTFSFQVSPVDFANVVDGTEVRWAFQLYGPGATNAEYYPTPAMRKEDRVYADPNASNGQSFRGALSRSTTTASK